MTAPTYRRQMLDHCMAFAIAGDPDYARYAASWYEANQPLELIGLRERVDRDIERLQEQRYREREASARKR